MLSQSLLPLIAGIYRRGIEAGLNPEARVSAAIAKLTSLKHQRPLQIEGIGDWLLDEYGLSGIRQFFNSDELAIDAGVLWLRKRGTPIAVKTALGWIDYSAIAIEDIKLRRRMWTRYQINMGAVPGQLEVAQLKNCEYLAGVSSPARSVFYRGFHGYDVRAAETSYKKTSGSIIGDSSGIRVGGKTKWSHGRPHTLAAILTNDERVALGISLSSQQVVDYTTSGITWNAHEVTWASLGVTWQTSNGLAQQLDGQAIDWLIAGVPWDAGGITWDAPGITWTGFEDSAVLQIWLLTKRRLWVRFSGPTGVVGCARVIIEPAGRGVLRVKCKTPFTVASGIAVTSISLLVDPVLTAPAKPGVLWLTPLDYSGGVSAAETAISFTFAHSIRELIQFDIAITDQPDAWFLSSGAWNYDGYWDDNLGNLQAASTDWFLSSGAWNEDGLWVDTFGALI